jgi:mycothiol synthase
MAMHTSSRFFGGQADVLRMMAFLSAARVDGSQPGYWHVGDLVWRLYQNTVFDPFTSFRLWEGGEGELLGFVCFSPPEWVDLQVHPRLRGRGPIEDEMLAWAEKHRLELPAKDDGTRSLRIGGLDIDPQRGAFLERHGFERTEHHYVNLMRNLSGPIPGEAVPEGLTVRHVADETEFEERVSIHREVWHPSKVTLEAYRRMRTVPGYTPELDLVAATPDGVFASYCICWLDPVSKSGEFEPVGTRVAFRRKQLGRAVMLEGLRRLKSRGAETALVTSEGSNDAALALYTSVGFRIINRDYAYIKRL